MRRVKRPASGWRRDTANAPPPDSFAAARRASSPLGFHSGAIADRYQVNSAILPKARLRQGFGGAWPWRFLCAAALALSACARSQPAPKQVRADVHLPRESETIEATVPRHATLDSLLRANRLQEQFVIRAVTVARGV